MVCVPPALDAHAPVPLQPAAPGLPPAGGRHLRQAEKAAGAGEGGAGGEGGDGRNNVGWRAGGMLVGCARWAGWGCLGVGVVQGVGRAVGFGGGGAKGRSVLGGCKWVMGFGAVKGPSFGCRERAQRPQLPAGCTGSIALEGLCKGATVWGAKGPPGCCPAPTWEPPPASAARLFSRDP